MNMESEKEMLLEDNIGNMHMTLGWAGIFYTDIKALTIKEKIETFHPKHH